MQQLWLMIFLIVAMGMISNHITEFAILALVYATLVWLTRNPNEQDEKNLAQRIKKLELELAALKKRLTTLEQQSNEFNRLPEIPEVPNPTSEHHNTAPKKSSESAIPVFRQPENVATKKPSPIIQNTELHPTEPTFRQPKTHTVHHQTQQNQHEENHQENHAPNPIIAWFLRGNPLLKTGMVILFLGLAFLLRYIGAGLPLGMKYLLVFGAGIMASLGGWHLQAKKRDYGLALEGFGFAVMYLTSLSALKWHAILPAGLVFGIMVILVALMAMLSLAQNAKIMAQVAVIGGLAAPVLVSDGSSNHLALFTYLALLNTGIAAMAWFKTWRSLNLIGFTGTFGMALAWGGNAYTAQHFATTEPFLLYHWLLYTLIACFFARNTLQAEPLSGSLKDIPDNATLSRIGQTISAYGTHISGLDSTLLFGTALAAFGLQYTMVAHWDNAAAWSALGFAAIYTLFAYYFTKQKQEFAVMKQAFSALTLLFITLAIPLALEGSWTVSAWTLEAALVYAFGIMQRQPQTRLMAIAVYLLAAMAQLTDLHMGKNTILTGSFIGAFLTVIGGVALYYIWHSKRRQDSAIWERNAQQGTLVLALSHMLTLPMLLWSSLGTMVAMSVYALAFSACQFNKQNKILSIFTLITVLLAVMFDFVQQHDAIGASMAILWLIVAMFLHLALWRDKDNANLNVVSGWVILTLGLVGAVHHLDDVLQNWASAHSWSPQTVHYAGFFLIGIPFVWVAKWQRWREGLQAALIGTALLMLNYLDRLSMWVESHFISGSLKICLATGLAIFLLRQTQKPIWHGILFGLLALLWNMWLGYFGEVYLPDTVWRQLLWLCVPFGLWLVIYAARHHDLIQKFNLVYWRSGSLIVAATSLMWLFYANWATPQPSGLPYIPVFNPVELATVAIIWQLMRWLPEWLPENSEPEWKWLAKIAPFALAWFAVSAWVMRMWHFYGDVDWRFGVLLASFGLQASLSIVWALMAIALMVHGHRHGLRGVWLMGATLMGVVVVKLFLVELGNSGGVARIVSFIVVGLLLLLVGWFAPAPPKQLDDADE